jgi:hypothetical protein
VKEVRILIIAGGAPSGGRRRLDGGFVYQCSLDCERLRRIAQRMLEDFVNRIDEDRLHLGAHLRGNILEVAFVAPGQDHGGDSRAPRREDFFLDAADRQDLCRAA